MTSPAPHAVLLAASRKARVIRAVPPVRGATDQGRNLGAEEAAPALAFNAHGRGPEEGGMCHAALRAHQGAGRREDEGGARPRAMTSLAPEIDIAAFDTHPVSLTARLDGNDAGGIGPLGHAVSLDLGVLSLHPGTPREGGARAAWARPDEGGEQGAGEVVPALALPAHGQGPDKRRMPARANMVRGVACRPIEGGSRAP